MPRTQSTYRAQADPRWVTVQLQIRVPWWRREQLQAEANASGIKLVDMLGDAVDRIYPPDPPAK